jgi:hypothetical protein
MGIEDETKAMRGVSMGSFEEELMILKRKTDQELRLSIRNLDEGNCTYATTICRNCENYQADPAGDVDSAGIVEYCDKCMMTSVNGAWPAWAVAAKEHGWKPPKGWKP